MINVPAEIIVMEDCASNYGIFEVESESNPDVKYTVELYGSEGPAHCPCESFKYSGLNRECKHIRALWEGGACLYNPQ